MEVMRSKIERRIALEKSTEEKKKLIRKTFQRDIDVAKSGYQLLDEMQATSRKPVMKILQDNK